MEKIGFKETDRVELKRDSGKLPAGTKGTIVYCYKSQPLFEVEVAGLGVHTVMLEDIKHCE